ncbi:hypothetical protein [Apibacter sp. HY039]|uniref:hypothetical protein n=1 Tax=Apibacter sp. HY039 TaxID=2501476 RepID=UPI0013E39001|nr:hypothetical protein [Apibacter sp. HY039]
MKRKLIAMLGAVFFTLATCSQKKEEPMIIQNPQINAKNIVEKLQQESVPETCT